jgi:protein ImuB
VPPLPEGSFHTEAFEARYIEINHRPIRLFAEPQPIEATAALPDAPPILFRWRRVVHRIRRSEGPERISPEWWRVNASGCAKEDEIRDYYRVETMEGLRFWVYRQGRYGGSPRPRWYLHGAFG